MSIIAQLTGEWTGIIVQTGALGLLGVMLLWQRQASIASEKRITKSFDEKERYTRQLVATNHDIFRRNLVALENLSTALGERPCLMKDSRADLARSRHEGDKL